MIRTEFVNSLFKLVNVLRNTGEHIFAPFRLTTRTYALMNMIHSGINTSKRLFSGVYGTRASLMKRLQTLENLGFVNREADPQDKRAWVFSLTPAGQDTFRAVQPIYQKAVNSVFTHILDEDLQIAQKVLIRMIVDIETAFSIGKPGE